MTLLRPDIRQVWRVLRFFGNITSTWPPNPRAGSRELMTRDLVWAFCVVIAIMTMIPLILNAYHCENDIVGLMKSLSELTALTETCLNMVLCRMARKSLQNILGKITTFVRVANDREKMILKKYIDRYYGFSVFVFISYSAAIITFSCGPLFMETEFPAEGWYPFSTEPPLRKYTIYMAQVLAIIQTGFSLTVDYNIAMFFWYSTARLEMLGFELETANTERDVKVCIRKHQEIISFVKETQSTVGYLICKSHVMIGCAIICGGIPLVYNQPFTVMIQFTSMVIGGCLKLYITAWPADDLREVSKIIAMKAYSSKWMKKSPKMSSSVLFMMQRSQEPLSIRMGSFLPVLSLQYYTNFIRTISSYFMTMRAVIDG